MNRNIIKSIVFAAVAVAAGGAWAWAWAETETVGGWRGTHIATSGGSRSCATAWNATILSAQTREHC